MHDYISTFPGKPYDWLVTVRASFTLNKAVWSSGMIPALGAGGPVRSSAPPFACASPTAGTHRGGMRAACAVAPTARHAYVHRPRRVRAVAATSADWNGRRRATTASSVVDMLELSDVSDEAMRALVPSAWREDDAATSHDRHPGEPTTRPRSAIIDPGLFDDAERPAFRMASRSRLTRWTPDFPGDDAFSTTPAPCATDALPRKELSRPARGDRHHRRAGSTSSTPTRRRWRRRDGGFTDDAPPPSPRRGPRRRPRLPRHVPAHHQSAPVLRGRRGQAQARQSRATRLVARERVPGVEGTRQVAVRRGVHRGRDADAAHDAGVGPRVRGSERSRAEARGRLGRPSRWFVLPPGIGPAARARTSGCRGYGVEGTGGSGLADFVRAPRWTWRVWSCFAELGFACTRGRYRGRSRRRTGSSSARRRRRRCATKTTNTTRLPVGAPSRTRYLRVRGSGTSSGRSDALILAS